MSHPEAHVPVQPEGRDDAADERADRATQRADAATRRATEGAERDTQRVRWVARVTARPDAGSPQDAAEQAAVDEAMRQSYEEEAEHDRRSDAADRTARAADPLADAVDREAAGRDREAAAVDRRAALRDRTRGRPIASRRRSTAPSGAEPPDTICHRFGRVHPIRGCHGHAVIT
jgi:hypothetical protein